MTENTSDVIQVINLLADSTEKGLTLGIKGLGEAGIKTMQLFMWVYMRNRKIAGGVSMKKLINEKGGDTQILRIPTEDPGELKKIYADLEKRGVMFHTLEDIHVGDNQTEIVFHPSDAGKIEAFLEDWQHLYLKQAQAVQKTEIHSEIYKENVIGWKAYADSIPEEEKRELQEIAVKEAEAGYQKGNGRGEPEVPGEIKEKTRDLLKEQKQVISVNEKMIQPTKDGMFISRMPLTEGECLVTPADDVTMKGSNANVQLTENKKYTIVDENGNFAREMTGKEIKDYYQEAGKRLNEIKKEKGETVKGPGKEFERGKKGNGFNNFQQRNYNIGELEAQLLNNNSAGPSRK